MALFGIYGKHTVAAYPWNNIENAKIFRAFEEADIRSLAERYKINEVLGQYQMRLKIHCYGY